MIELILIGGPTALLRYGGLRWLTDPTLSPPGEYAGGLVKTSPPALAREELGQIDVVLLSHDQHADNLDPAGRELLGAAPRVLTTVCAAARLGCDATGLKPWASVELEVPRDVGLARAADAPITVTAVPALHGPSGCEPVMGPVVGFVLSAPGEPRVYVSGDNASLAVVRAIAARFAPIEVAILFAGGVQLAHRFAGAYLTLTSEQAAVAARLLGARVAVPLHFEGWKHFTQGAEQLRAAFAGYGVGDLLYLPEPGRPVALGIRAAAGRAGERAAAGRDRERAAAGRAAEADMGGPGHGASLSRSSAPGGGPAGTRSPVGALSEAARSGRTGSGLAAEDLALACSLADAADRITLERFRAADLAVETKPDLTPVSEADRAVELELRARIASARPGDAVLGEEFGDGGGAAAGIRRWIIDPIDGTKSYVRGMPTWATLIALEVEDTCSVAVVSMPALGRRWWARRGGGAFVRENGVERQIRVSRIGALADAQLVWSGPEDWEAAGRLDAILALARACWRTRGVGDAWQYMLVAEGAAEIALDPVVSLWDLAAPRLIVEEAGGRFTDLAGAARADGGSGVASNGLLHEAVLALLAGA